jgi:hypothetical protein
MKRLKNGRTKRESLKEAERYNGKVKATRNRGAKSKNWKTKERVD